VQSGTTGAMHGADERDVISDRDAATDPVPLSETFGNIVSLSAVGRSAFESVPSLGCCVVK
jgi:hypothetical protein